MTVKWPLPLPVSQKKGYLWKGQALPTVLAWAGPAILGLTAL